MAKQYPHTPDGRYFVAKNRLWRCTDPRLDEEHGDDDALRQARDAVQAAKEALGERGPVWWDDNAPDEGGFAPHNSSYAKWWESQL